MYCSPPGSSVHGILQARILEWVAISSSRGIFLTQGSNLLLLNVFCIGRWVLYKCHLGSPAYLKNSLLDDILKFYSCCSPNPNDRDAEMGPMVPNAWSEIIIKTQRSSAVKEHV